MENSPRFQFSKLSEELRSACAAKAGLLLPIEEASRLLCSLFSSRFLWIDGVAEDEVASLLNVVDDFFGTSSFLSHYSSEHKTFFKADPASPTLQDFFNVNSGESAQSFWAFYGSNLDEFSSYFASLKEIPLHPNLPHEILLGSSPCSVPANLSFLFFGPANESIAHLDPSLPSALAYLELHLSKSKVAAEPSGSTYPFIPLKKALEEANAIYFLKEDLYQGLDRIAEKASSYHPFAIPNPLANTFERFSSIALALGEKPEVAFNEACASLIMPGLADLFVLDSGAKIQEFKTAVAADFPLEGGLPLAVFSHLLKGEQ